MFGSFYFPDGTQPVWESVSWLQKEFMMWFNEERTKTLLTFPVESFALIYKDGQFVDEETAKFVAEEYSRGHSFFTYISDTVDSLSSCCRLRSTVQTKEFNFTNGNMGIMTGSKSVISLNLNRIIQDWWNENFDGVPHLQSGDMSFGSYYGDSFSQYLVPILNRVYKYHTAYNELLWDMYDANLLPVYTCGFIDLNKQYLTIGINGLNEAAEFMGIQCNDNPEYEDLCNLIFSTIKEQNRLHNGTFNKHKLTFNTECVPAESLAIKNYNWDKADGYKVPEDRNLYASYIFIPSDPSISVLDKFVLHGSRYIGEFLDGGSANHVNLQEHLSYEQYWKLLNFAAKEGCQYFTFNIPNSKCTDCGHIAKVPLTRCPKCGSTKIDLYDRVIG
nr:MAG TPA: anaerobic ribonucleoside triphosphate reductase [Caudoviricetes sp.]